MEGQPTQSPSSLAELDSTRRKSSEKAKPTPRKRSKLQEIGTFVVEPKKIRVDSFEQAAEDRSLWQRLLRGDGRQAEHIGQMLLEADTHPKPAIEKATAIAMDKHVETLSRNDLLELSSKIVVDGGSLYQMYETHLIGEKALRRLVAEHLGGGNIREALRRELVEHEIDFERDPLLRDKAHQILRAAGGQTLHTLLKQADVKLSPGSARKSADPKVRALHQVEELRRLRRRRLIDISLVAVILILLSLVIILAITRLTM